MFLNEITKNNVPSGDVFAVQAKTEYFSIGKIEYNEHRQHSCRTKDGGASPASHYILLEDVLTLARQQQARPDYVLLPEYASTKFRAYEVSPIMVLDGGHHTVCEDKEAEFYSVFGVYETEGRECIADCRTEKLADELVELLSRLG